MDKNVETFLRNLLNPDMFGFAVSAEVRDEARKLLGMQPVETTKGADYARSILPRR